MDILHNSASNWKEVRKNNPCPVCGKTDWCFINDESTAVACGRVTPGSEPSGWRYVKETLDGRAIYAVERREREKPNYSEKPNTRYIPKRLTSNGTGSTTEQPQLESTKPSPSPIFENLDCDLIKLALQKGEIDKPVVECTPCQKTFTVKVPVSNPDPEVKKPIMVEKQVKSVTLKKTIYKYNSSQWVERAEYFDDQGERIKKIVTPWHLDSKRNPVNKKGENPWAAYQIEEAAIFGEGNWVLGVEGEACVDIARVEMGVSAITWQGSGWSDADLEKTALELKSVGVAGFAYMSDNDSPGINKAAKVQNAFDKVGLPCVILVPHELWDEMPDKGDIVDWIEWGKNQSMKKEDFIKRLEEEIKRVVRERVEEEKEKRRLAVRALEAAIPGLNQDDPVGNEQTQKPPTPDVMSAQIASDYQDIWLYNAEINSWMEYGSIGVWKQVNDLYITNVVHKILKKRCFTGYGDSYLKNVVSLLRLELYAHTWGENKKLLPFTDCVLELDTGITKPHSPSNRLTWVLPRPYKSENSSWRLIDEWLSAATMGNPQDKRLLLHYAAAVLRQQSIQKFLHLIGPGGSGKTTFMNLLMALVGKENTLSIDLDNLNEKDAVADLFGKVLVVFADQDSAGRQLSNFKKLTGGDNLRGRRLYRDGFNFRFTGMSVMTSNNPIFQTGTARWLTRRAIMVPFKFNVQKENIRNLEKDFEPELSAFTNYLLSIPVSEIEAVLNGLNSDCLSATLWESQIRSDGLASWVNDCLIRDNLARTQIGSDAQEWANSSYNPNTSTLFGSYCHTMRKSNRKALTKDNFSAQLLEVLQTLGWEALKVRTSTGRFITGVRLRTENDLSVPCLDETLSTEIEPNQVNRNHRDDHHVDHHVDHRDDHHDDLKPLKDIERADHDDLTTKISQEQSSTEMVCSTHSWDENQQQQTKKSDFEVVIVSTTPDIQSTQAVTEVGTQAVTEVGTPSDDQSADIASIASTLMCCHDFSVFEELMTYGFDADNLLAALATLPPEKASQINSWRNKLNQTAWKDEIEGTPTQETDPNNRVQQWVRYQGKAYIVVCKSGSMLSLREAGFTKIVHKVHLSQVEEI